MQASFSELEYAAKKKVTRRDRFLREMEKVTPWSALVVEIEPFDPKGGGQRPAADGRGTSAPLGYHPAGVLPLDKIEQVKASIRAKVEHGFHIVKNLFGMRKVRDRGWAKHTARLYALFGLANRMIANLRMYNLSGQDPS